MKKHKFSHTVTEHHGDGSHTVHHIHEKNGFQAPAMQDGDVKSAVGNHDAMMDHVMDHTSEPNPGEGQDENEEALEESIHPGIHKMVEKAHEAGKKA